MSNQSGLFKPLPLDVIARLHADEADILARKSMSDGLDASIKQHFRNIPSYHTVTINNEDLEKLFAEPRKAVSGAFGFSSRLVWQAEGFIFIDTLNAVEVY